MLPKIIVDTREQLPLFSEVDNYFLCKNKLEVGDYTTLKLLNRFSIERKSPLDLYGSLVQGHVRFRNELLRANSTGITLIVMVECLEREFYLFRYDGGWRLGTDSSVIRKILQTTSEKYNIPFYWCVDRDSMRDKMLEIFNDREGEIL